MKPKLLAVFTPSKHEEKCKMFGTPLLPLLSGYIEELNPSIRDASNTLHVALSARSANGSLPLLTNNYISASTYSLNLSSNYPI
jgi:hypothetical protein